jgi:hypothetical protein
MGAMAIVGMMPPTECVPVRPITAERLLTPTLTPTQAILCEQWRTAQQHKFSLFQVLRIGANSGGH